MDDETWAAHERKRMTEIDIASRGIDSPLLLAAFEAIPRECFLPPHLKRAAYKDRPLPIGQGQTISQPYIVARTLDALELKPTDCVLEIGTGSGYAAALLGFIAAEVHTVERIEELANKAKKVFHALPPHLHHVSEHVFVHHGDGTLGLPQHAPYDAIAVAAGGPVVPQALIDQLAVGGRLVMPVASKTGFGQTLVRVRRVSERDYEHEELEDVHFVPLIGAQGHASDEDASVFLDRDSSSVLIDSFRLAPPGRVPAAARLVKEVAQPFERIIDTNSHGENGDEDDPCIEALVDRLADSPHRVVLLGESTHGTSEFYRLRATITRRLIEKHGFNFVAVESDWPDAERVDGYVRSNTTLASTAFPWAPFERFPNWMWRNQEVSTFVDWLREFNDEEVVRKDRRERAVGFHGLDLYSMYTSMRVVVRYLSVIDPAAAQDARDRYALLLPRPVVGAASLEDAPQRYGIAVLTGQMASARHAVVAMLRDLLMKRIEYMQAGSADAFFDAAQNARVVESAERYYRAMLRSGAESWNLRDMHMFDTLRLLLAYYGPRSRAIVWAHNSHVGDARATEMRDRRELNLGQLCRQGFGEAAVNVGFATDHGQVLAAHEWDAPGEVREIRHGHPESYEAVMHESGIPAFVLTLENHPAIKKELCPARLMRAIGVVYRPQTELQSHYFMSVLPDQLDELVWIDRTSAVHPIAALGLDRLPHLVDRLDRLDRDELLRHDHNVTSMPGRV
jgi:protein-L-isoaspartate(D-aspartate) O-methyltransferase